MGLDWQPGLKPKAGHEQEFNTLRVALSRRFCWGRRRKQARFDELIVDPVDALNAPIVGRDDAANAWAVQNFENRVDETLDLKAWLQKLDGLPVVDLVRPCDGLPPFSNGGLGEYIGPESFRAQFLKDCVEIIGEELWDRCYEEQDVAATLAFANALEAHAEAFAAKHELDYAALPEAIIDDDKSDTFRLQVIRAAVRWCRFWAARGHGVSPWF